ncbi:hypothetical protein OXX69_008724, partial [Metschnikowia pulcherrima]
QAKKHPSGKGTSELSGAKKAKAPIECISQNDAVNILDEGDVEKANDSHISIHQKKWVKSQANNRIATGRDLT